MNYNYIQNITTSTKLLSLPNKEPEDQGFFEAPEQLFGGFVQSLIKRRAIARLPAYLRHLRQIQLVHFIIFNPSPSRNAPERIVTQSIKTQILVTAIPMTLNDKRSWARPEPTFPT